MTTDATRPALDAGEIEEGRQLLAALTRGPYSLSSEHSNLGYDIDPLPQGLRDGMDRVQDARAVLWLVQHADALLTAAAERERLDQELDRYGIDHPAGLEGLLRHIYNNREAMRGVWRGIVNDLEQTVANLEAERAALAVEVARLRAALGKIVGIGVRPTFDRAAESERITTIARAALASVPADGTGGDDGSGN